MSDGGRLLHVDDYPHTLRLLGALVGGRSDRERLGYASGEHVVVVDWQLLLDGPLSSTEVAIVHVARGCATLERTGGVPAPLAEVVADVVRAVL